MWGSVSNHSSLLLQGHQQRLGGLVKTTHTKQYKLCYKQFLTGGGGGRQLSEFRKILKENQLLFSVKRSLFSQSLGLFSPPDHILQNIYAKLMKFFSKNFRNFFDAKGPPFGFLKNQKKISNLFLKISLNFFFHMLNL